MGEPLSKDWDFLPQKSGGSPSYSQLRVSCDSQSGFYLSPNCPFPANCHSSHQSQPKFLVDHTTL
jgi:hypothetical protein